jgi:hypothetical protein
MLAARLPQPRWCGALSDRYSLLITTIWGGGRRCATRLQQLQGCCALAIVTPAPVVVVLAVPRTALNLQAIEEQVRTR